MTAPDKTQTRPNWNCTNQEPMGTTKKTHVTLTTYNVVSAGGTHVLQVLQMMADLNTDIAIHMETKLCGNQFA